MVRNFEIDELDQHTLSYIESSEVFLSSAHILFSQKCWIFTGTLGPSGWVFLSPLTPMMDFIYLASFVPKMRSIAGTVSFTDSTVYSESVGCECL